MKKQEGEKAREKEGKEREWGIKRKGKEKKRIEGKRGRG